MQEGQQWVQWNMREAEVKNEFNLSKCIFLNIHKAEVLELTPEKTFFFVFKNP